MAQKNDNFITVEKPLRIDFAGGWSDTPPICNKLGGTVLNAAVLLNGKKPVSASVRYTSEIKGIAIHSEDLGKHGIITTKAELSDRSDPHDWKALVKSALTVVGYDFSEGGIEIHICAKVPKGSGLGTSSILGAALVEALQKLRKRNTSWETISALVLKLEKDMQTGGGWQDQVGGLLPGVKLLKTEHGAKQKISATTLSSEATQAFNAYLNERALLYFTGRKRMARNVLNGVVKFFNEDPDGLATEIIKTLKHDAEKAFRAIENQDWQSFSAALNSYWLNKKALDPGSTNPPVESIIARIAPWTEAVTLCGAGGGGFMLIIARSPEAKEKLQSSLNRHSPIKGASFYSFALVTS